MATVNEGATVDVVDDDPFAKAFAEAVAISDASSVPEKGTVVPEKGTPESKPDAAAEAAAKKAADDKAAAEATDAAAKKAADDKAAAEAAASTPEAIAAAKKLADDKAAAEAAANTPAAIAAATARALVKEQAAATEAAQKKAADDKVAADAAAAEAAKHKLTDAELKELESLKTEWADIVRLFELKFKENSGLAATAQGQAMKAMLEHIYADIQPIALSQKEMQEKEHFDDIYRAHADFDAVHPKLMPWIETQPAYLQKALKEVYTGGTAEEVNDLVQRFKDASGIVTPKADDVTIAPTNKQAAAVDPKKVAALTPVDSQRSQVQDKGVDKNSFDAGWDEAISLASKK